MNDKKKRIIVSDPCPINSSFRNRIFLISDFHSRSHRFYIKIFPFGLPNFLAEQCALYFIENIKYINIYIYTYWTL